MVSVGRAAIALMCLFASASAVCGEADLPLAPERTVEFTTRQGTWMSVDVAPDGRSVVFDVLGDLYRLPIAGGQAVPLTRGMAYDAQPRYSPDGQNIVFVSDRDGADNLWIMRADGSAARQLTHDAYTLFVSPTFTPDGRNILVSRHAPAFYRSSFELWLYPLEGGRGVRLLASAPTPQASKDTWNNALGAVASADGRFIYYAFGSGYIVPMSASTGAQKPLPYWQIRRRDRLTGEESDVTSARGSAMRPVLSPDGQWLVYGTRQRAHTDLRIRHLASGEDRLLRAAIQRDDQQTFKTALDLLPGYAFTPDGQSLVVSYDGQLHRISVSTGEAEIIPMTVPVAQPLGPRTKVEGRLPEGPVRARLIQRPALSPDGRQLAFTAFGQLQVMALPAGQARALTKDDSGGYQPAWSADGRWLVYVSWKGSQGGAIWKRRADGTGKPIRLTTDGAHYRDPVFAPDGRQIFALRMPRQDFVNQSIDLAMGDDEPEVASPAALDLVTLDSEGGPVRILTRAAGLERPHFSADRKHLYFSEGAGLAAMNLDGSGRRTVLRLGGAAVGHDLDPDDRPTTLLSPDGQSVLTRFRNRVYRLPMIWAGLSPLSIELNASEVPVQRLDRVGADQIAWSADGRAALWSTGATVFVSEGTQPVQTLTIDIERPRAKPHGVLLLTGARIVTMKDDEVLEEGDILIEDNRIVSIGARGSLAVPASARRIDVTGATIIPGFIDLHPHTLSLRRGVLDREAWSLANYLAYGITTGRDPQAISADTFVYEDWIEAGEIPGYRPLSTGHLIPISSELGNPEEAVAIATRYRDYYRVSAIKSYLIGNRRQRQWMLGAAHQMGLMATTEGAADFRLDLTHVIDGFTGNEHMLPYAPLYDDVVQLFARSGVTYTPALLETYGGVSGWSAFYQDDALYDDAKVRRFFPPPVLDRRRASQWTPSDERYTRSQAAAALAIARAGGEVCVGSHGNFAGVGFHWNLRAMQEGGWQPMEALRAATMCGARGMGLAQDIGSLEPAKLADLLVLNANPLEDLRHSTALRYVIKNGFVYEADTLRMIWPEVREAPRFWW